MKQFSKLKNQRNITYFGNDIPTDVSVIVGLFNAEIYLQGLFKQIESQTKKDVYWLFLDNNSEDNTYATVREWLQIAGLNAVLVRNPINLGATGSTYTNLDLVKSKWVTFVHQDDFYKPTYISTLWDSLNKSEVHPILIYGDMGRVDESGKKIGAFPSPSWVLPDHDQVTYFLSLIRNHCVPWPAVMVQKKELESVEPPWHSAAFPDTELTLKLAAHGKFLHVGKEVMAYRDNLHSESRSLQNDEREFGSALGLIRVFGSSEFITILEMVQTAQREEFVAKLLSSIRVRFSNELLTEIISAHALETINQHWDYADPSVLQNLSTIYSMVGASRTVEQLDRLAWYSDQSISAASTRNNQQIRIASNNKEVRSNLKSTFIILYGKFGGILPFGFRKAAFTVLIKKMTKNNSLSAWNYFWKTNS